MEDRGRELQSVAPHVALTRAVIIDQKADILDTLSTPVKTRASSKYTKAPCHHGRDQSRGPRGGGGEGRGSAPWLRGGVTLGQTQGMR